MGMIKCPDCGRDVSDQAPSCPGCGRPLAQTQQQQMGKTCPRCNGNVISFQNVQTGSIGAAQNKVVIQQKKSKGCLYWLIIGWWWEPLWFLCFGWIGLLFGGKNKSGVNLSANKTINKTVAICQNCGYKWNV